MRRQSEGTRIAAEEGTVEVQPGFDPERCDEEEFAALQARERRLRDFGAATYLERLPQLRGMSQLLVQQSCVTSYIAPRESEIALDAGAGVGRYALLVAPKVRWLLCVDFSREALRTLRSHVGDAGLKNVESLQADLCSLPSLGGRFDVVYSVETLQHIPTHRARVAAVAGLRAALRLGGRVVLVAEAWGPRSRGPKEGVDGRKGGGSYEFKFTPDDMRRLMHEAGFPKVRVRASNLLPGRLTDRGPWLAARTEALLARAPMFAGLGWFVIGMARK